MKISGIARPVDSQGRVVIPVEIREVLKLGAGEQVVFQLKGGNILMQKHEECCVFCHDTNQINSYMGRPVCRKCIGNLSDLQVENSAIEGK